MLPPPRAPYPITDLDRRIENLRAALRAAIEANIRMPSEFNANAASSALITYRREVEIHDKVRLAENAALRQTRPEPVVYEPPAPVSGPGVPRRAWVVYAGVCGLLVALGAALEVFWR